MFALIFFFFFAENNFWGSLKKSQKLEPVKLSCHKVSHSMTVGLGLHVANCHYQTGYKEKKNLMAYLFCGYFSDDVT